MSAPEVPLDRAGQTLAGAERDQPGIRALLAMDRHSSALEPAEFLAGMIPPHSTVRVLTVVSYQAQPDSPWSRLDAQETGAQIVAAQSEAFAGARRVLEMAGAHVTFAHRFGLPADEILNEASEWGADVILVGHHNGLARWFLGSVTESIVKRSSVPVLIVPKLSASEARRDLSLRSRLPA
jgi:nucleotide-binding universal stress UspA family protein